MIDIWTLLVSGCLILDGFHYIDYFPHHILVCCRIPSECPWLIFLEPNIIWYSDHNIVLIDSSVIIIAHFLFVHSKKKTLSVITLKF